ncbi:hypothetical protein [Streptomyces sp. FR-008]|uniref:hypothetical protein n=1 Tax=Streptomyces sp. FR-008 TaxID=206662 RepID=UPI00131F3463|nr:hypothetical protein [Streptomyces sp. FR-008]
MNLGSPSSTMNVARWALIFKVCFVAALLRFHFPLMIEELFDQKTLPLPTWEWSIFSLTSAIPVLLARKRNPAQREELSYHITFLRGGMLIYLAYSLIGAIFAVELILLVAAVASSTGLLVPSLMYRRERAVVR